MLFSTVFSVWILEHANGNRPHNLFLSSNYIAFMLVHIFFHGKTSDIWKLSRKHNFYLLATCSWSLLDKLPPMLQWLKWIHGQKTTRFLGVLAKEDRKFGDKWYEGGLPFLSHHRDGTDDSGHNDCWGGFLNTKGKALRPYWSWQATLQGGDILDSWNQNSYVLQIGFYWARNWIVPGSVHWGGL